MNDLAVHGIGIVPFAGLEYRLTDYFGIGGQLELGYLWAKTEVDVETPLGNNRMTEDTNGMILAILLSASVYF